MPRSGPNALRRIAVFKRACSARRREVTETLTVGQPRVLARPGQNVSCRALSIICPIRSELRRILAFDIALVLGDDASSGGSA